MRSESIDLGSTPPWSLPAIYHPGSAMRSTQVSPPKPTINPSVLTKGGDVQSVEDPTWFTLNKLMLQPLTTPAPLLARENVRGQLPPIVETATLADGDQTDFVGVEVEPGSDDVYMLDTDDLSWAASLASEDDPEVQATLPFQVELALSDMKKRAERYAVHQTSCACDAWPEKQAMHDTPNAFTLMDEAEMKWQTDLLLRSVLQQVKREVVQGALMILERMGPVDITLVCAHPRCPAPDRRIPPGAYYVVIGQQSTITNAKCFCLFCLEWLWSGRGMAGSLPEPTLVVDATERKQDMSGLGLDGTTEKDSLAFAEVHDSSTALSTPTLQQYYTASATTSTPATQYSNNSPLESPTNSAKTPMTSPTTSPLVNKNAKRLAASAEAKQVTQGMEEQPVNELAKSPMPRAKRVNRKVDFIEVRHSARLKSVCPEAAADGVVSPRLDVGATASEPPKTTARKTSADVIADKVRRAERGLEKMYGKRADALAVLVPGAKPVVLLSKSPKGLAERTVIRDAFGITYTDLLADSVKYWVQPRALNEVHPV